MTAAKRPTSSSSKRPARKSPSSPAPKAPAKRGAAKRAPAKRAPAGGRAAAAAARESTELVVAVTAFITERKASDQWSKHHAALAELALELARKLAGYLESPAPVARELRETLTELAPQVAADDRLEFLRDSGTPTDGGAAVGDSS